MSKHCFNFYMLLMETYSEATFTALSATCIQVTLSNKKSM